jgi:hypothetical protein
MLSSKIELEQQAWRRWVSLALSVAMVVGTSLTCIRPLLSKTPWMLFEEDDFFYYLKVAENLARGAGSTFNTLVPTNGYHPLWLLVLTAIREFVHSGRGMLAAVAVMIFAATIATYVLCRRLLADTGTDALVANALAIYVAIYSIHVFYGGMEVILTIPLIFAIALVVQREEWWTRGFGQSFALGLMIAAMVLSRLDSMLLALLLLAGLLTQPELRSRIRLPQMAGLALGVSPIAVYLAVNHHYFHTWTPISGMAKQLKASHLPSSPAWHSLVGKSPAQIVNLLPIAGAILLLPVLFRRFSPVQRVVYPALLVFPFFHILVVSMASDWQLWGWYFYAFRVGLLASLVVFCLWRPTGQLLRTTAVTLLVCLFSVFQLSRNDRTVGGQDEMYEVAVDVTKFSATHPGVYAMGDRSGMVGYLLREPLVQTEGLMMDRDFMTRIAQRMPLREALAPYHVRYYIGTSPKAYNGCFHADEPYQAGPQSPQMKAVFCEQPAATFVHGTYRTMIFDLAANPVPGDS